MCSAVYYKLMDYIIPSLGTRVSFSEIIFIVDEDNGPAQSVLTLSIPQSTDIIIQVSTTSVSGTSWSAMGEC